MKVPAVRISFSEPDIEEILAKFAGILRGESFLSQGPYAQAFETAFAQAIGVEHAVSCSSGTAALEMICRGLDLAGGEVILPSNTFVATANAILNAGATPVFADCGSDLCLSLESVRAVWSPNTRAVMQVHIGGQVSGEVPAIRAYCEQHGAFFLEDAAQAHGSALRGVRAGAYGKAAAFSFFSTKVMTTGEGGMVVTQDAALAQKMRAMREFGKMPTDVYINTYGCIGYNWRMPEVAALLGLTQLRSLEGFIARRQAIAALYDEALAGVEGVDIVPVVEPSAHNYFKYLIVLTGPQDRAEVHRALLARGVQPSGYVYELPLHKQPIFPEANRLCLPRTESLCARHMALPIYPALSDAAALYVVEALKEALRACAP